MERTDIAFRTFALLSGVRQSPDDFVAVVEAQEGSRRKGTLAVLTEPAGDHPSLGVDACKLALKAIVDGYFADDALSLTSSLLTALQEANNALLQYNFSQGAGAPVPIAEGALAVQSGGNRARRARVGLAAMVMRPDGTGIYLSQLSPSQTYIVHHGLVSALPEPSSWQGIEENPKLVPLPRISEARNDDAEPDEQSAIDEVAYALPAQSLGSSPGVEVDLIFRRVEIGDLVVLVSSSLARHLDRQTAEELFASRDADTVINGLYAIADEHGLARAHACVLQLGEATPAVPVEDVDEYASAANHQRAQASDVPAGHHSGIAPAPSAGLHTLQSALSQPKTWLQRLRTAEESGIAAPGESTLAESPEDAGHPPGGGELVIEQVHTGPTGPLLRHTIDQPPYLSAGSRDISPTDESELLFDGWEDAPPYAAHLAAPQPAPPLPRPIPLSILRLDDEESDGEEFVALPRQAPRNPLPYNDGYPVPTLFPDEEEAPWHRIKHPATLSMMRAHKSGPRGNFASMPIPGDESEQGSQVPRSGRIPRPKWLNYKPHLNLPKPDLRAYAATARRGLSMAATAARNLLPDGGRRGSNWSAAPGTPRMIPRARSVSGSPYLSSIRDWVSSAIPRQIGWRSISVRGKSVVPVRWIIVGAAALIVLLLIFSVLGSTGNKAQNAAAALLAKAKQEDLLANQPGVTDALKQQHILAAQGYASQALAADPSSAEAQRLVTKLQGDLDKAQGITRLTTTKLLFDLDNLGAPAGQTAAQAAPAAAGSRPVGAAVSGQAASAVSQAAVITPTISVTEIAVQSNDAYILDRDKGKLYRCHISTQDCTVILSNGDSAGGQTVGKLSNMTLRVSNLLAVDDKLTAYIFDSDGGTWQAQPLGGSDGLGQPKDIATYDGNLYLLNARAGQVTKYASGAYGSDPVDWIQDQDSVSQVQDPVAMTIDGAIYVLLANGKVLVMEGGKVSRVIEPKGPQTAPASIFTSGDSGDLYVLRPAEGTISRISKNTGQTLANYKTPATLGGLTIIDGVTVDEGRGKLYLVQGRRVYQATLPSRPFVGSDPTPQPTVEP